ncbi:O-antigen polymerase [Tenacibaculum jejuense]|uniref:Oligosaccharide repeat unit polymerase n=1 Tax=Tenacibaculum jejuense TaxID=584609 RepID=A0A238U914_9FLAO|nr:O-antigen polymerase [Tenacibaculum jejuense]SNR14900.1 Probable transmembrane protein of unknown function. Putative exopolysaccharide biosysthesis protein [Tenacibaculum jejuense]
MGFILQVLFFFIFLLFNNRKTKLYFALIVLQFFSFLSQFLVGAEIDYDSPKIVFSIVFININLFLILAPWRYAKIQMIYLKNKKFVFFFKRILYKVLLFNFLLGIFMLIIIRTYIPSIASFKAEGAYRDLYDQIPYFANLFRYSYLTQNLGYFAIPFFFYYLSISDIKKSRIALLLSSSSIIAGIAFYSRAQIFTYVMVFFGAFLLLRDIIPLNIKNKINRRFRIVASVIVFVFVSITVTRFSEMDYYKDRIPPRSRIKDPIVYSIADYAAQGYYNGVNRLELYTVDKTLYGEGLLRIVYQFLDFFGVIYWDSDVSKEKVNRSFDYKSHLFYGYTCQMVYNFGYTISLLLSFFFYLYIKRKLNNKKQLPIENLFILILLLVISIVSIFYCGFELLYIALLFFSLVRVLFFFRKNEL